MKRVGKKKEHTFDYDLIVIGSGASGNVATLIAAKSGLSIAIIESDKLGGSWPNYSDIPVGAVLKSAILYDRAKKGSEFGLRPSTLGYNFPALKNWKDAAIKATGVTVGRKSYEKLGINVFMGDAHFLSPNEISVRRKHISASKFLITTGSHWRTPPITGIDTISYLTPQTALDITRLPKSMLIVGGSNIAIEYAQLFSLLGVKVFFAHSARSILPEFDKDISNMAEKALTRDNQITFLTSTKVVAAFKDGFGVRATLSRNGTEKSLRVDQLLIADAKTPNIDLGLSNANVLHSDKGIQINNYFRTSNRHIFAAGDVLGNFNSTQTNILQGKVAVDNIIHNKRHTADYSAIPTVLFTHPGIAMTGTTEREARANKQSIRVRTTNMNEIARTSLANYKTGMVKIITDKDGVVIGGAILSPYAGELINELSLAVHAKLNIREIASSPHSFLTWGEAIRITADKFF